MTLFFFNAWNKFFTSLLLCFLTYCINNYENRMRQMDIAVHCDLLKILLLLSWKWPALSQNQLKWFFFYVKQKTWNSKQSPRWRRTYYIHWVFWSCRTSKIWKCTTKKASNLLKGYAIVRAKKVFLVFSGIIRYYWIANPED